MILPQGAVALALLSVLALAGCSSVSQSQRFDSGAAPEQLTPIESSTVASSALPPIGQDGNVQVAATPGQPQPLQPGQINPNLTGQPQLDTPTTTASTDGSFVTLDSVGAVPNVPGRDLSGGLTEAKLLGGWTVVSGATQCRLNLTQTTKTGTSRYRASTPGCQLPQLAQVSSWQLAGTQVQLFDDSGTMIAALILSGQRFIGTLSGGQGISMVG
jgi:Protease inhibitor Inh